MSGVAVVRYLLAHNAPLLAVVSEARIMAGDLPLNTVLPAIEIKHISGTPFLTMAMDETKRLHTDRVQVTAHAKAPEGSPQGAGYPGVKVLLKLVLAACKNTKGIVNGIDCDSVLPDLEGPDLSDAALAIYTGSWDFIVKYNG